MAIPIARFIDVSFRGHLKSIILETLVESTVDIVARLSIAAAKMRETPGSFGTIGELLL